jgi:hypothetical protein
MNPNEEEDLTIFEEYKLYPKEKYIELLKPDEITNYPLDEYIVINEIEFKMLDDLKIYIIENNLKLSFDGKEDILSEPYQYQNMSRNDIKHLKSWFWWKDRPRKFIAG